MKRRECPTAKTCSKCQKEKPLSEFYFHKKRGHYDSRCKACAKAQVSARAEKKFAEIAEYQRLYRANNREMLAEQKRTWYSGNRESEQAKRKQNYLENAEAYKRRNLSRYVAKKEEILEKQREYNLRNIVSVRSYQREFQRMRKASVKQAIPPWYDSAKAREIYAEAARLSQETGMPYHVDHIVPLLGKNVCGLHWHGNLQVLPATDNISKGNRLAKDISDPRPKRAEARDKEPGR